MRGNLRKTRPTVFAEDLRSGPRCCVVKLSRAIRRYVAAKHAIGVSYRSGRDVLEAFSQHVGDVPLLSLAKWQVLEFLDRSRLSDVTWLFRFRILKAFFEYWLARDHLTKLPLPPPRRHGTARSLVPYIYSVSELRRLLERTCLRRRSTPREFSSVTFRTLLLFLYGTGARINETLALRPQDVNLDNGTVTFHRPPPMIGRTIPIGPHLCRNLRNYADSLASSGADRKAFFARRDGKAVRAIDLTVSFQKLRRQAALSQRADISHQPQVRDLRRTFAVHCLRTWLREGKDLRSMLPVLGAYLGQVSLSSTEAYLAVTPERFLVPLASLNETGKRRSALTTTKNRL